MGISLIAAFILPFEVFLLAYAILGPLHYLTEISWLHDRQYFAPKKLDWIPLAVLGLLILLGAKSIMGEGIYGVLEGMGMAEVVRFLGSYGYDITFIAFGLALIFVVFKDNTYRIVSIIILLFCAYLFHIPDPVVDPSQMTNWDVYNKRMVQPYDAKWGSPVFKIFGVYVPTLIHVYVFTGAFMLFGALKSRSKSGYWAFGAFVVCAIACFVVLPNYHGILASEWAQSNYEGTFSQLSLHMFQDFGGAEYSDILVRNTFLGKEETAAVNQMIFTENIGIMFARFIAFAYTYHYLNWFSKTSVIKWHQVPKLRFAMVIVTWIGSVALYMYDYDIGFRWLFLLSFLHVMLEFPLNHHSFIGIGKEFRSIFSGGKAVPAKSKS